MKLVPSEHGKILPVTNGKNMYVIIQSHFSIGLDTKQDTRSLGFRPEPVFPIGRWII